MNKARLYKVRKLKSIQKKRKDEPGECRSRRDHWKSEIIQVNNSETSKINRSESQVNFQQLN